MKLDPITGAIQERWHYDSNGTSVHLQKSQETAGILESAKGARDIIRKDSGPVGSRYLGTVPLLIAQQWAKECGAAVGSKEWSKYAVKKLKDPDWAKLRVHL